MTTGAVPVEAFGGKAIPYMEIEDEEAVSRKEFLAQALGKEGQAVSYASVPFDYYEAVTGEIKEQDAFSPHFQVWKWDMVAVGSFITAPIIGGIIGCFSQPKRVEAYVKNVIDRANAISDYVGKVLEGIKGIDDAALEKLQAKAEKAAEKAALRNAVRRLGIDAPWEAYKKALEIGDGELADELAGPALVELAEAKQKKTELEERYKGLVDHVKQMDEDYQKLAKEVKKAKVPQPYLGGHGAAPWYRATQPWGGYGGGAAEPIDLSEEFLEDYEKTKKAAYTGARIGLNILADRRAKEVRKRASYDDIDVNGG